MPNARFAYAALVPSLLSLAWLAEAAPPTTSSAPPAPAAPVMTGAPAAKPPAAAPAASTPPPLPNPPTAKPVPVTAAFSPGSGMVVLERGGKVLGIGTILNADGRILTALSTLVDARPVDVRYADGGRATARIGHADRGKDLALVVPQNGWRKQGLKASAAAIPAATLRAFTGGTTGALAGARVTLKGPGGFRGLDGKPLTEALELATPLDPASAGTPLVDDTGEVNALVTRACRPTTSPACVPVAVALPIAAVRDFLRVTPVTAALPVPTIGLKGIAEDTGSVRGVRLTVVAPGSPATVAGLKVGKDARTSDVLVAIDGIPVITPDQMNAAVADRSVGEVLDLLLFTAGRFRHATVVVAAAR